MKKDDCIFCKIANGEIPSTTLYEDADFRVIFDINPASKGHALLLPKEHCDNVFEMEDATASKIFCVATKVARALQKAVDCEGMNLVQNNGEIAGQTVFHFHLHFVPRYQGDTVNVGWVPGEADMDELTKLAEAIKQDL